MLIDTSNNTYVMGIFSIWLVQPLPYHSNAFPHSASKVVLLKCLWCYNNILVMWVFMAQYLVTAKRKIALAKLPRFHYKQMICEIVKYTIVYKLLFRYYILTTIEIRISCKSLGTRTKCFPLVLPAQINLALCVSSITNDFFTWI